MKFYAVAKGFHTGIFHTWQETKIEVEGYSGAVFKKFNNQKDAQGFLQKYSTTSPAINRTESKQKSPEKERPPPPANTKKRKAEPMPPNHSNETQKKPNRDVPKDLKIHIMFDGGSRGNPGVAGAGALVSVTNPVGSGDYNTYSLHCRYFVGDKETNNVAEYSGLLLGLRVAWREIENAHPSIDVPIDVLVQGDSELIVKQLKGIYKCRNQSLKTLFNQVMSILNQMRARYAGLKIDINHVYRSDNAVADGKSFYQWTCLQG